MPRPRGPHGSDNSVVLAVRVPLSAAAKVYDQAGAERGSALAEYLRSLIRRGVGIPLDFQAGYEEGKMQGWAEANANFRAALKGTRA